MTDPRREDDWLRGEIEAFMELPDDANGTYEADDWDALEEDCRD